MTRFSGVVYLDRDGTLIEHHPYLSDPALVALVDGAGEAVARLNRAMVAVVLVTNQSGLARGLVTDGQLAAIHARLVSLLAAHGARLDALYHCPHLPDGAVARYRRSCRCRKPAPGMVERAVRDLELRGLPAWVVGDDERDVGLAAAAGATSILVRTGHGAATARRIPNGLLRPNHVTADVGKAVALVLQQLRQRD